MSNPPIYYVVLITGIVLYALIYAAVVCGVVWVHERVSLWFRKEKKPVSTISHYCTKDLSLAAYLELRGAKLQGFMPYGKGEKYITLTFTHRRILDLVADYENFGSISFSPKAFMEMRYRYKHMNSLNRPA